MFSNPRTKRIAAAVILALLLAAVPAVAAAPAREGRESWIVRLAGWLGLPPALTAVWETDSANIDPLGQPKPTAGEPEAGSAGTDDSANIDPNG